MKKLLFLGMAGLAIANPLVFKEVNVNGTTYFVKQDVSNEVKELISLKRFDIQTKALVKILNTYLKHKRIFNSAEDTTAPVLSSLTYAIRNIINTNDYMWKKPVSYNGKSYSVVYNFFRDVLNDKTLLLSKSDKDVLDIFAKEDEDLINKIVSLENEIAKIRKHKLKKREIAKIREFYMLLGELVRDYKETLISLKSMENKASLQQALESVIKRLNFIEKNIQTNIKNLSTWDSIRIYKF